MKNMLTLFDILLLYFILMVLFLYYNIYQSSLYRSLTKQ